MTTQGKRPSQAEGNNTTSKVLQATELSEEAKITTQNELPSMQSIDVKQRYAFLIGVSDYMNCPPNPHEIPESLRGTSRLASCLIDHCGVVDTVKQMRHLNSSGFVKRNDCYAEIDSFVTQINKEDLLILFFSGHGTHQGLLFSDSNGKDENGVLLYTDLARLIARSAGYTLLIIDCCYAGIVKDIEHGLISQLNAGKIAVLYSCSSDEMPPATGPDSRLFIETLMLDLSGERDSSNIGGITTIGSIAESVINKVKAASDNKQNPGFLCINKSFINTNIIQRTDSVRALEIQQAKEYLLSLADKKIISREERQYCLRTQNKRDCNKTYDMDAASFIDWLGQSKDGAVKDIFRSAPVKFIRSSHKRIKAIFNTIWALITITIFLLVVGFLWISKMILLPNERVEYDIYKNGNNIKMFYDVMKDKDNYYEDIAFCASKRIIVGEYKDGTLKFNSASPLLRRDAFVMLDNANAIVGALSTGFNIEKAKDIPIYIERQSTSEVYNKLVMLFSFNIITQKDFDNIPGKTGDISSQNYDINMPLDRREGSRWIYYLLTPDIRNQLSDDNIWRQLIYRGVLDSSVKRSGIITRGEFCKWLKGAICSTNVK